MATVGAYQDGIRRMLNDIGIYLDADLQEIPLGSLSIKDGCLYCGLCERNFSARDHLVGRRHRNFKYSYDAQCLEHGQIPLTYAGPGPAPAAQAAQAANAARGLAAAPFCPPGLPDPAAANIPPPPPPHPAQYVNVIEVVETGTQASVDAVSVEVQTAATGDASTQTPTVRNRLPPGVGHNPELARQEQQESQGSQSQGSQETRVAVRGTQVRNQWAGWKEETIKKNKWWQ